MVCILVLPSRAHEPLGDSPLVHKYEDDMGVPDTWCDTYVPRVSPPPAPLGTEGEIDNGSLQTLK